MFVKKYYKKYYKNENILREVKASYHFCLWKVLIKILLQARKMGRYSFFARKSKENRSLSFSICFCTFCPNSRIVNYPLISTAYVRIIYHMHYNCFKFSFFQGWGGGVCYEMQQYNNNARITLHTGSATSTACPTCLEWDQ